MDLQKNDIDVNGCNCRIKDNFEIVKLSDLPEPSVVGRRDYRWCCGGIASRLLGGFSGRRNPLGK